MHMAGRAAAQRAAAIVEHDLRDGAEQIFADTLGKLPPAGCTKRRDAGAHDVREPAFGGGEAEDAVGGRDQPPREADPLGLVAVEQVVGRAAV